MPHKWTDEQIAFIADAYTRLSRSEVTDQVNAEFGLCLKKTQVIAALKNRRIRSGRNGQFSGQSWNAGTAGKGICKPNKGSFKKGNMTGAAQHNYQPLGTTRISKDGYLERKVTDDPKLYPARRWAFEHRLIWEQANGPIPNGHAVVFLDGDQTNLAMDNLRCVHSGVLGIMNKRGLNRSTGEARKAAILTCELDLVANQRSAA